MTKYDMITIAIIIFAAIAFMLLSRLTINNNESQYAIITVEGKEYRKIDLKNAKPEELTITTSYGYNTIEIGKNRIRIKESSCPDKLCIKQGWISKPNEISVCLPNRVSIKVIAKKDLVDDIAY